MQPARVQPRQAPQNWTALPAAPRPQAQAQAPQQKLPPPPPAAPQPRVARGNGYDSPAPVAQAATPLSLPSPEQLGVCRRVAPAYPAEVDWNAAHAELRRLGAVGIQFSRVSGGGYRFAFQLPTGDPVRTRHVDATGATEAEAVYSALHTATARQP